MAERDKWSEWLVQGRQHGFDDRQVARMHRVLRKLATRVVRNAKLRPGQLVLDVGAGTGLLALEARRRVKATGSVVACDLSLDALRRCRDAAGSRDGEAAVRVVSGNSLALPFPDGTFDAVLTRSVLIYLDDKPAGIRELHRVLKPGGRFSVFEPINEVWRINVDRLRADGRYDEFQPIYDRLVDFYDSSPSATFLGWDERSLLCWFEDAGFREVALTYEHTSTRPWASARVTDKAREQLRASWKAAPNPHDPSFEKLVRRIAATEADEFLDRFLEFELQNPAPTANAVAYVAGRK